jgi:sulfatase maturation enzyme AslB (radical SAM superfamily)
MRNSYIVLKLKLFLLACLKRKITLRKLWNVLVCSLAYVLKCKRSGRAPFILSLELGNECNANCLFCRDEKGVIHDTNKDKPAPGGITKGVMPFEMAEDIIGQVSADVLIAVLYTNGEPLLYPKLADLIRHCTRSNVLSMIATNGLLLTPEKSKAIVDAGIDFIKLQLSGFTQDIYHVQVRYGDVERLKENIRNLVKIRDDQKSRTLIMLDYILYQYNQHQLPLIREFCRELGIMLSIRPGNPQGGLEDKECPQSMQALPLKISCDWLWKGMQVNFNGHVLPCCDGVIFSAIAPYEIYQVGKSDVRTIWNGPAAQGMRHTMTVHGRGAIRLCSQCYRHGVAFKW